MSDSSEEEDLSRFQEVVDESFIKKINANNNNKFVSASEETYSQSRSQRYIEEATHYNDVKVSKELQKKIGTKVSEIINRNLKFVNVEDVDTKQEQFEGGVKLFRDSVGFLSCEDAKDTFTENHNNLSRKIKKRKRIADENLDTSDEEVNQLKGDNQQDRGAGRGSSATTDDSIRLNGKLHVMQKGKKKDCRVCSDRTKNKSGRRETVYYCDTCIEKPRIHLGDCFLKYHTKENYRS